MLAIKNQNLTLTAELLQGCIRLGHCEAREKRGRCLFSLLGLFGRRAEKEMGFSVSDRGDIIGVDLDGGRLANEIHGNHQPEWLGLPGCP